ncbi:beta-ketoacyl synthase N-terminal-like domain-containing protein [Streptomyces sp. 5-6(2022)]|uniref:type I polyketide synthase n=1 Tax=Streptomyces sp. 5-6(2022) TaxID=2936510 RepID=UPI0023B9D010|nr:beta-ketoacyl synthase N-terminal-like domain-containing protein [Streptomyces sp. 5-6(2022)]
MTIVNSGAEHQAGGDEPYGTDIAVIGMAGRFPGARDLDEFWDNLTAGRESVTPLTDADYLEAGGDPDRLDDPYLVKVASVIDGIDEFDAEYFGYPPSEAELLDPQQRLFLECAHHTLEHAGYGPDTRAGSVGVYAGALLSRYFLDHVHPRTRGQDTLTQHHAQLGNVNSTLATRVSYELGLTGPSVSVQTACSTSLVAVHLACQDLLAYRCDMALAGGVSLNPALRQGYRYVKDGPFSRDGHCRPFDADATGMIAGEGLGAVLLKRLEEALADGDHIHAVIKGSAVNNDGDRKVGFAAPSAAGQAEVIVAAQTVAGVDADTITYVEAHGTGTPVGDPIEVSALTRAFSRTTDRRNYCALGSVKSNIGHTDAAAGIAGLIKTVLALEHRTIPATLHFRGPNPLLGLDDSPFHVPTETRPWSAGPWPRRAGVSSLGIGGTNVHLVLEEAPVPGPRPGPAPDTEALLPLSARTPGALDAATARLARHLRDHPALPVEDVAHTLQSGRRAHPYRRALVCRDTADAVRLLSSASSAPAAEAVTGRPVVFLFPGAGSQHPGMGQGLYDGEAVYRQEIDRCAEILEPALGRDLRDMLYGPPDPDGASAAGVFPALVATELALARLLDSWGIRPTALLGHSLGEYTAACLAGVLTPEEVLPLVVRREELFIRAAGEGGMLSVALGEEAASRLLTAGLSLAAVNGPDSCTLAGAEADLVAAERRLLEQGVPHRRIRFGAAAHSALLDPILDSYLRDLSAVPLRAPRIPYVSNLTGTWITPEQATDPASWLRHTRKTVRFDAGLRTVLTEDRPVLLEVGPGRVLTGLVRAQGGAEVPVLPAMRHPQAQEPDLRTLLDTVGQAWAHGVDVDWSALSTRRPPRRVPLPGYPFERRRHWIEAHRPSGTAAPPTVRSPFPVKLAAELPRMARSEERLRKIHAARRFPEHLTRLLDRLAVAHVRGVLQDAGIDTTPGAVLRRDTVHETFGTVPAYRPFLDALLRMLVDDGVLAVDADRPRFTPAAGTADAAALTREILERYPDQEEDLSFLDHCVRHYPDVLKGTMAGTEVLLPDGSDDRQRALIDRRLAATDVPLYRRLVAETVRRLVAEAGGRPVRILEAGSGRGYLTWEVVEELRGLPGVEYHFTDLGRSFVLDGRRQAERRGLTGMEFGVLDVTRDPSGQGYPPATFDIVLAFNVLHATPDLRRAVRNVASLLVPDGVLLLLEAVSQWRWSLMTTGLYEGWWYFDDDLRDGSPLIGRDQWTALLGDEGFADVTAFPGVDAGTDDTDHLLVAARRTAAAPAPPTAIAPVRRSLNRRPDLSVPCTPPGTDREKAIVRIWEDVLGIDGIGIHDNFFDLGGESLLAMQLIARLRDLSGTDLSLRRIFEAPTVAGLIPLLDAAEPAAAPRIRPSARRGRATTSPRDDRTE